MPDQASMFLVVGSGTMANWAAQKHRKYKKEFGSDYPRNQEDYDPFHFLDNANTTDNLSLM
jgi:very-long-chain enoyl-CoA reductase